MPVRPIRLFGDPVLTTPAVPVADFDAQLRALVRDLDATLAAQPGGTGLAAPQIGVGLRVFVFHAAERGHLVNPVLEFPDEEVEEGSEFCLSIPGLYYDTRRRRHVVAKGYTSHGDPLQVVGAGRLSRLLQHEYDHLDGVLFIDRLNPRQRARALREISAAGWSGPVRPSPHPMRGGYR